MNKVLTLGDVASIVDCEHKTAPISENGSYFAVGTPAMKGNLISFDEARRIDEGTFLEWTTRLRPVHGDLLLAREAPVGPVVRIPPAENVAPGQRTVLLRPDDNHVDGLFLFYLLISPMMQRQMGTLAAGSTVAHLNVADVRNLQLPPLPHPATQRGIGEVLGALDDKIATNLEVASTLDEIGAMQFQKIAENSPRSPVGDVATLVLGGTPNRSVPEYWNGSVPWISSGACNQKIVTQPTEFITELGLERSAAKMLPAKTTVVAITGATLGKMGWLGSAMSANQSVVGVHAHSTPAWIHHALRSEQTQLMNWATGGAQQHVNKGAVAAIEVPFESNRAQVFEALIGPLMDRAVFAMQENATLTAVRDELLPQLMSGRITVKDAEKRVEEEV